jgi:hypothetical protein
MVTFNQEDQERIAACIEMAAEVEKEKRAARYKKKRNKSGLISRTPIQVMNGQDFENLINHNTLYKNLLITYAKMGFYDGLPVNSHLSLYDIQKVYKHFIIIKNDKFRIHVVARNKTEAIQVSKTPKRNVIHIIRINREGKEAYLKVGVPQC